MTNVHRIACAIAFAACAGQSPVRSSPEQGGLMSVDGKVVAWGYQPNTLSDAERRDGWRLLFDGKSFDGWRGLGYDSVPRAHWKVENGTIRKLADGDVPRMPDGQPAAGGDLMTRETFRDFQLAWEWKISRAGNSGVKYNVSEEISMANAPNHAALGFEYQMLDDSLHEDNKVPSHRAGALYDLIPPNANKVRAPVGDWNKSAVVFRGNHGEHWLNGRKVVEFDSYTGNGFSPRQSKTDIMISTNAVGPHRLQNHVDEVFSEHQDRSVAREMA